MSNTMFYLYHLGFLVLLFHFAPGNDIFLQCQEEWKYGGQQKAILTCNIKRTSLTKCVIDQNVTGFQMDGRDFCTVDESGYNKCLPSGSDAPDTACWCEYNETDYLINLSFRLDENLHNGTWTCQKTCFDATTVNNPLQFQSFDTCKKRQMKFEENPSPETCVKCVMFDSKLYCSITGDILFIVFLCTNTATSCGLGVTGYKLYVLKKKNLNCSEECRCNELATRNENGDAQTKNNSNPHSDRKDENDERTVE